MIRSVRTLCLAGLLLAAGCGALDAEQQAYLKAAEGRASQAEVEARLGKPKTTRQTVTGGTIWTYEVYQWQPGNRTAAPGTWCDEYELRFDTHAMLQTWSRQSYFHGGEAFPQTCGRS